MSLCDPEYRLRFFVFSLRESGTSKWRLGSADHPGGGATSPLSPSPHLKAASSGEPHTDLGADFCLLYLPRLRDLPSPESGRQRDRYMHLVFSGPGEV